MRAATAAVAVGLAMPASPAVGGTAAGGALGTNLAAVTYYDGATVFANIVEQAGDWVPQDDGRPWGEGPPLDLRDDGWPRRLAGGQFGSLVLADSHYPSGRYPVSWSGTGRFDIGGTVFRGTDGTGEITLDGTSTVVLNLRQTDPDNPVHGIQVRVPGADPTARFTDDYLRQLAPYRALRFMDWQRTNSTLADPERSFTCANRTPGSYYSQGTSRGASVPAMVALANATGTDPWFTIPHEASLDWVRCHARVVADTLAPGLVPRYEFSNETWNPAFRAFHDLSDEAARLGLGGGDRFLGLQQLVGRRHVAVMDVVGEEMGGRPFLRVLAGQAANPWVLEQRLAVAGDRTDEIAIAPYLGVGGDPFDPAEARRVAAWSSDELMARLRQQQAREVDAWVGEHVQLAGRSGKRLVAYEGGQHLAGDPDNASLTDLFTAANRSSAMGDLYRTYLTRWADATDGALFMHYTDVGPASRYGSWGALEASDQDPGSSPKYRALADFAGVPPTATPVAPAPGRAGISVAGGDVFTRHRRVLVAIDWPAAAESVRLSNTRRFRAAREYPRGARVRWRLPASGRVVVRARFRGPGVDAARTVTDAITVDREAPRLHQVAVSRSPGGPLRLRSRAADRVSGVMTVTVAGDRAGTGSATVAYRPRVRVAPAGRLGARVFVRVTDRAGNVSVWRAVPVRR